jgi:hypothetical protein
MARLKFLVFALVALGLWAYHFTQIGPLAMAGSVEQAQAAVAGAAGPVSVALESRRSLTQAVALKAATGPAAWNPGPKPNAKPEAPTVDRFAAVRAAASELVPSDLKEALFVALSNEVGALAVKGSGEPATALPEGFELAPIVEAGAAGAVRSLDGASYLFFAAPLVVSDKNEVRAAGTMVVGLPLLPDAKVLDQAAKSLGLETIALVAEGKPVLVGGNQAAVTPLLSGVKANSSGPLGSGPVRELGPLPLPVLVDDAPHAFGSRVALAGTPFEVAASASARAGLDALASYQVFALGGLVGLLLLSLVVLIIIGGGEEAGASMVMPPPMPIPPSAQRRDDSLPPKATPLAMPEVAPAPEASPDDFDFPMSSPSGMTGSNPAFQPSQPPPPPVSSGVTGQNPLFEPEPTSDPFASSAPPPPPPPPAARPQPPPPPVATTEAPAYVPSSAPGRGLMDDDEAQRTVAYPALKSSPGVAASSADPFAMAAAAQGYDEQPQSHEDNPEATRVAAVPAELIRAARASSGGTTERPAMSSPSRPPTAAMPRVASIAPGGGANDEERHFQDVFRDFVATREKCKEPADGLTFDKFKAKLLKNKEQLVAKYNCKTVRFQVYVKDGKAALKATPVKD